VRLPGAHSAWSRRVQYTPGCVLMDRDERPIFAPPCLPAHVVGKGALPAAGGAVVGPPVQNLRVFSGKAWCPALMGPSVSMFVLNFTVVPFLVGEGKVGFGRHWSMNWPVPNRGLCGAQQTEWLAFPVTPYAPEQRFGSRPPPNAAAHPKAGPAFGDGPLPPIIFLFVTASLVPWFRCVGWHRVVSRRKVSKRSCRIFTVRSSNK
jgi:hypothetical protein